MKHLLLLLLACPLAQVKAQQSIPFALEHKNMSDYLAKRKPAKLIIQLKNLPDTMPPVAVKFSMAELGKWLPVTRHTEADKNGRAEIALSEHTPFQQVWLRVGKYLYSSVYVNTGLTVTIDVQKVKKGGAYMTGEGVVYAGEDGRLTTVMNEKYLYKEKERQQLISSFNALCDTRKKYDETVFLFKVDSIRKLIGQIDDEFIASAPEYGWAIKNETASDLYGKLCVAYWNDNMPDHFMKPISSHQPYFTSYNGALFYYNLNTYNRRYKTESLEKALTMFDSLYPQQRSDITKLYFLETESDTYENSYPLIINSIKTGWCKRIAMGELATAKASQKTIDSLFAASKKPEEANIGTPLFQLPFNASLYQLDKNADIDEFIGSLRSKFANKALILDFWSTWCPPCIADLPYSAALHEQNKDLPIEYIYLCTTQNVALHAWKKKIVDLQLPGTHIFVDQTAMDRLRTALNAQGGFPTYVVIDVNGKVKTKAIFKMQTLDRAAIKKATGL